MQLVIENIKKVKKYKTKRLGIIPIYFDNNIDDQNDIMVSLIYLFLKNNSFIIIDKHNTQAEKKTVNNYLVDQFSFQKINKKNIIMIGRVKDTNIYAVNINNSKNMLKDHSNSFSDCFNWNKYYSFFEKKPMHDLYKMVKMEDEMNDHYKMNLKSNSPNQKIFVSMYILIRKILYYYNN